MSYPAFPWLPARLINPLIALTVALILSASLARPAASAPTPPAGSAGDTTLSQLGDFTVHLPMLVQAAGLPDLVVERIATDGGALQVVIRNQGDAAVQSPFWVDLYVAPDAPPTAVNQVWQERGDGGAAWHISGKALPLAPGAALTLRLGDAHYWSELSSLGGPILAGTSLYAQVDSADALTTYGGVLESHERAGGAYNNISGPVPAASLIAQAGAAGELAGAGAPPALPAR
jgi:hypothetical protein